MDQAHSEWQSTAVVRLPGGAQLRCLLLCQLAGKAALFEQRGEHGASEVLRSVDRMLRQDLAQHHGIEIDKTDGFLLLFEHPPQALRYALALQQRVAALGETMGLNLRLQIGIHVGELLHWSNAAVDVASGAKPVELEGLAKAIAARLMDLAEPGQILLSESAWSLALQRRAELDAEQALGWVEHGRYRLYGVAQPLTVYEVGVRGRAPLRRPRDTGKARQLRAWHRHPLLQGTLLLALLALVLGWALGPRPAIAFVERDWLLLADSRNLTPRHALDAVLDSALRIGLEQSPHVNLVSGMKTRDVLQQMRKPGKVAVDRALGSEVAVRIGARAVLLPTLSEVDGRLRLVTELIDPHTQTTVHTHSTELGTADALLDGLDEVSMSVRSDLGEPLALLSEHHAPLAEVTTSHLDALRLYSEAGVAKLNQAFDRSAELLARAIAIDPEFAMAHLAQVGLALIADDGAAAQHHLALAEQHLQRLSRREQLFVQATAALGTATDNMLARWQSFAAIFPDDRRAAYNYALFAAVLANDCAPALALDWDDPAEPAQSRAMKGYEVATCLLWSEQVDAARQTFAAANALGLIGNGPEYAVATALAGDLSVALQILDLADHERPREERQDADLQRIALRMWAGDRSGARQAATALAGRDEALPPSSAGYGRMRLASLMQDAYADAPGARAAVDELLRQALAAAEQNDRLPAHDLLGNALTAYWLLQRLDHPVDADLRRRLQDSSERLAQTPLRALFAAAEAERLRDQQAQTALQQLDRVASATAPYLLQATRMRLLLALGRQQEAREHCLWLQAHPGRALSERIANGNLALLNVFERAHAAALFGDSTVPCAWPALAAVN